VTTAAIQPVAANATMATAIRPKAAREEPLSFFITLVINTPPRLDKVSPSTPTTPEKITVVKRARNTVQLPLRREHIHYF